MFKSNTREKRLQEMPAIDKLGRVRPPHNCKREPFFQRWPLNYTAFNFGVCLLIIDGDIMKQENINKFLTEALAIECGEAKEAGALGYMARALGQKTYLGTTFLF